MGDGGDGGHLVGRGHRAADAGDQSSGPAHKSWGQEGRRRRRPDRQAQERGEGLVEGALLRLLGGSSFGDFLTAPEAACSWSASEGFSLCCWPPLGRTLKRCEVSRMIGY